MEGARELIAPRARVPALPPSVRFAVRAPGVRVSAAVLALAALTFAWPSAPTYDPWAWIVWGREVLHLDLSTADGPSWKPLPVVFTTIYALFGSFAPELWLFTARAGAIASVVVVYRLARRLGGPAAGAAAAAAYAVAPWTVRNAALGSSEGMLVALALGAVDRQLAGRDRQAFLLGLAAALLRPEVWPLVILHGAWLVWRRRERALVAIGLAATVALWLVPEKLGSGDFLRAAHRARTPNANSPAFSDDPVRAVVDLFASMLTPALWVGLGAALVLGVAALVSRRVDRRVRIAAALAGVTVVLVGEVAYMTSDGFAGNSRYLILPAALVCVLAGTGIGWAIGRVLPRGPRAAVLGLAAIAALAFAAPSVGLLDSTLESVEYQARLAAGLDDAIAQAGGSRALLACGEPYTGAFQVPLVAYHLGVHTSQVELEPRAPAVAFRARNIPTSDVTPPLRGLAGEDDVRTLATGGGWRIVASCR